MRRERDPRTSMADAAEKTGPKAAAAGPAQLDPAVAEELFALHEQLQARRRNAQVFQAVRLDLETARNVASQVWPRRRYMYRGGFCAYCRYVSF